jgi:ribonuclease HII
MELKSSFGSKLVEAGCDEAGRGCLAGPVYAAAVIFPKTYANCEINDSKKLTEKKRFELRKIIEKDAVAWAVASVDNLKIDTVNILKASILAMHLALDKLDQCPELLLIDGNRFIKYKQIPHQCIIKGDGLYLSIAAASILAKTHRDEYMRKLSLEFPHYGWERNKGYPTLEHRKAIVRHGQSPYHRLSFATQLDLW